MNLSHRCVYIYTCIHTYVYYRLYFQIAFTPILYSYNCVIIQYLTKNMHNDLLLIQILMLLGDFCLQVNPFMTGIPYTRHCWAGRQCDDGLELALQIHRGPRPPRKYYFRHQNIPALVVKQINN